MSTNSKSEATNYRIIKSLSIPILLIIFVLLFLTWNNNFRDVVIGFLTSLLVVLFGFVFWDVNLKRKFSEELFDLARISENIRMSGLVRVEKDFYDIDFENLLKTSRNLECSFVFGRTLFNAKRKKFMDFIDKGGVINCYIPDFKSDSILENYRVRFSMSEEKTRTYFRESYECLKEIGVNVFFYEGIITSSYYLLDDCAIFSVFNQGAKDVVPAFVAIKESMLFEFISNDFKRIKEKSKGDI